MGAGTGIDDNNPHGVSECNVGDNCTILKPYGDESKLYYGMDMFLLTTLFSSVFKETSM